MSRALEALARILARRAETAGARLAAASRARAAAMANVASNAEARREGRAAATSLPALIVDRWETTSATALAHARFQAERAAEDAADARRALLRAAGRERALRRLLDARAAADRHEREHRATEALLEAACKPNP